MNDVDQYVRDVLRNIQATPRDLARIEADLRAHLEEALATGETPAEAISRMGSPAEVATEFMVGVTLDYAGFWRRLAAFAVDMVIILALGVVLIGLIILFANLVPVGTQIFPPSTTGLDYVVGAISVLVVISLVAVLVGLLVLYFPILEGRFGQTAGKRLLGMRVIKETGGAIGYKEAFLRRLSFYFNAAVLLVVDALFIVFTDKRQRAFDIIAKTVVIKEAA